jgi:hypothetical protein
VPLAAVIVLKLQESRRLKAEHRRSLIDRPRRAAADGDGAPKQSCCRGRTPLAVAVVEVAPRPTNRFRAAEYTLRRRRRDESRGEEEAGRGEEEGEEELEATELDDGGATTVRRRAPPSRHRVHDCSSPARAFEPHTAAEERCLRLQQVRAPEMTTDAGALPHAQRYRVVVASVDVSAEFSNGSRVVGTATLGQVCTKRHLHRVGPNCGPT